MPPRYTKAQIYRRRRIAAALLLILVIVGVSSCTVALVHRFSGDDATASSSAPQTPSPTRTVNPVRDESLDAFVPDGFQDGDAVGIDVSSHQGEIDWARVADAGVGVAYIKATEGVAFEDPRLDDNLAGAIDNGLQVGVYHYFSLCSDGAQQAADFLKAVPPSADLLPPALDLEFEGACDERPGTADARAEVEEFLAPVEEAWGRRAVLYMSSDWTTTYGAPDEPAADAGTGDGMRLRWNADHSARPDGLHWALWQTTFSAEVPGVKGSVDFDVVRLERLTGAGA